MKTITRDGVLDHLFRDDRDDRIEEMELKQRLPSYGGNNLYKPNRALSADEIEAANRIGMVAPDTVAND